MKKTKQFIAVLLTITLIVSCVLQGTGNAAHVSASSVWNGKTDTTWYTGDLDYYEISTAEQFAGFAKLVNDGISFEGVTICLTDDIVLNTTNNFKKWDKKAPKNKWTMIGSSSHPFRGIFNGQGHKIVGLYIKDTKKYSNWFNSWYADGGLFGYVKGATIVNLKMQNAYINTRGNIGTVSVQSQNSNFYGIDINNVKLLNGNAGGIVCKATYDYTETYLNLFTVIGMEALLMAGGVILNPLVFGDALSLPKDFAGNIFFSCKVKNLTCQNTQTTGGVVAIGGNKDSGIGIANSLVMNYSVKSNGRKGVFMGVKPSNDYAVIQNCYTTNSKIKKGSKNKKFIDSNKVKKLSKLKLILGGAEKLGKAFEPAVGKEPSLKIFTTKKYIADEAKYKVLDDGYYNISYGKSYLCVDKNDNIVTSSEPQKFYFQYRSGGYYTITNEAGYVLSADSTKDDVYGQKIDYNEHRFTQRWVLEKKNDSYYMKLMGTEKAMAQLTSFTFIPGRGVFLDKDWFNDEDISYNVIWKINKAEQ